MDTWHRFLFIAVVGVSPRRNEATLDERDHREHDFALIESAFELSRDSARKQCPSVDDLFDAGSFRLALSLNPQAAKHKIEQLAPMPNATPASVAERTPEANMAGMEPAAFTTPGNNGSAETAEFG
jgi:hypothetical protein